MHNTPARERGILFSAPMVRAIQAGTKTQTRRTIKDKNVASAMQHGVASKCCPYRVGDRLWVREAWKALEQFNDLPPRQIPPGEIFYTADSASAPPPHARPRPGMFMPRWASRLTLEVIDVRAERLHACSAQDAIAEGIQQVKDQWRGAHDLPLITDPRAAYRSLWDSINGNGSWDGNPWVWVVEFRPN